MAYTLPKMLTDAGIKYCLSQSASWATRNLPFQAGQAAAYGLDKELALRAITLSTAEILGVEKDLGSLEVGKKATIVISKGDILDHLTNQVTYMYIDGRQIDLDNKHKELYRKYQEKITRASGANGANDSDGSKKGSGAAVKATNLRPVIPACVPSESFSGGRGNSNRGNLHCKKLWWRFLLKSFSRFDPCAGMKFGIPQKNHWTKIKISIN